MQWRDCEVGRLGIYFAQDLLMDLSISPAGLQAP